DEAAAGVERGVDNCPRRRAVMSERVPRPEPDDRPEPPLLHLGDQPAREAAGGEGGGEEPRIVVWAAAHVVEWKVRARLAPVGDVADGRVSGRIERATLRPRGEDVVADHSQQAVRVVREPRVSRAGVPRGDT